MCLCCTTLRGVTYFMVNVHMLATFGLFLLSAHTYLFQPITTPPPGLEDVNPLFIQNFPLLMGGYTLVAALFSCFIYRAIDMESLFQLTWSVVSFGGFQFLVIFLHLVFTVMFRDLVSTQWQVIMIAVLICNFSATFIYLTILFLYGKKIHLFKYGQNIRNSIGNNNIPFQSSQLTASILKKRANQNGSMNPNGHSSSSSSQQTNDLNLLENHPPVPVSRTNSVCKSTSTDDDLEICVEHPPPSPPPPHEHSPPPSYHSTPEV